MGVILGSFWYGLFVYRRGESLARILLLLSRTRAAQNFLNGSHAEPPAFPAQGRGPAVPGAGDAKGAQS